MVKKSIRAKLMLLLTTFAVIPVILIAMILLLKTEKIMLMLNEKDIAHTKTTVNYYFNQKLSDGLILARMYTENPEIKGAFVSGNREKLNEVTAPCFEKEKKERDISVFEFGDSTGKVFFRGHNPSKYGDDKSDNAAIKEALKGNEVTGFEFGKSGLAARAFTPIKNNDQVIGSFQIGYNLNDALLKDISVIISGDISFYEKDLLVKSSSQSEQTKIGNQSHKEVFEYLKAHDSYQKVMPNGMLEIYIPIYDSSKTETIGMIGLTKDISYMKNLEQEIILLSVVSIIILLALSIISAYGFSNNIVIPIKEMQKTLEALSQYNLAIERSQYTDKILKRTDEIGIIAGSIVKMRANFVKLIKVVCSASTEVAVSTEALTARSQQLAASANGVAKTIEEIAVGASTQAKEAEQGVHNISILSRLIEQDQKFRTNLNQCADEVDKLKDEGLEALAELTQKTTESSQAADSVYDTILKTEECVQKIERASQMIKRIAKQTNLLAINASIEATKVTGGNHGFTVVAEEVKKLAEEANRFADEIFEVIEDLMSKTNASITMMKKADTITASQSASVSYTAVKFEGIAEAIERMKETIEGLNQASTTMENKKEEIVCSIESLSAISEQNAGGSKEAAVSVENQTDSIEEIASASEKLANLAETLRSSVARFEF